MRRFHRKPDYCLRDIAESTGPEATSVRDTFLRDIAEDTAATRRHTANLTAAVQGLALATIALTIWTLHKTRSRS